MCLKIGLSGNRYSGKSRVCKIFNQVGIPVFEADVILKFILLHNYELQSLVADKIGRKYFNNGVLDYDKVINGKVFSDILSIVEKDLFDAWERFQKKNYKSIYCIFHSSMLFERGWDKKMDKNISVFAPYSDRIYRCKFLTNESVSKIYSLTKSEMDELKKNSLSDFVIHNYNEDSVFGDILTQVNRVDKSIIDNYLKGKMTKKIDVKVLNKLNPWSIY